MVRIRTSDRIHDAIRDRIVSGDLTDGTTLSIYRIADEYGVSRTPVRDAVLRLAQAGLVTIERNLGVTVHALGPAEIVELFDVRLLLEVPLAERAARIRTADDAARLEAASAALAATGDRAAFLERDHELHRLIASIAGAHAAADVVDALRERTELRGMNTLERERTLEQVHAEHAAVVAAVVAGDAPGAGAAMRDHLISTADIIVRQVADRLGVDFRPDWSTLGVGGHRPVE